ncbi:MAG: SusD/RagB family nutrient-binding outer membrane lipoprotein [Polaribacter sp.]
MKKIIKNNILLFVFSLLIFASCDTVDFGDINDDPNGPTQAIPSQLLAQAQKYVGGTENNSDSADDVTGVLTTTAGLLYTQQVTEGQYPGLSRYSTNEFSYNEWYTGPMQNLNEIIKVNEDPETSTDALAYGDNDNQIAVSKLLRAYFLQYMTDTWGYLPWEEAFKGKDGTTPKFDSQESIYDFMFAEIDDALSRINSGDGPSGDVMFNGDMSKWRRFGNMLKMIMALRISDANPTLAQSKFESAVSSGALISSNDDNLVFTYSTTEESDNPWEDRFESREDYIMSETMVEKLRTNLDPRLFKYSEPSRDGMTTSPNFPGNIDEKYVGAPNGKVNGNVPDYSFISLMVIKEKQYQAPIYTLAQVKFSLAEAALKGWNVGGGTTANLFKEGIEASMEQWGVDTADINSYTATHTSATISDIAYEKWVALYLNGSEAWAEWRRLDAPALTPSTYATDQRIPVRHSYSSAVADNNPDNYATMVSAQGPDTNHTKLWWDVN